MKKLISIIATSTILASTLVGCSSEGESQNVNVDLNAFKDAIYESYGYNDENMDVVSESDYEIFFDFGDAEYSEMIVVMSKDPVSADQFFVAKASTADDVELIEDAFNSRIEKRKQDFEGYAPTEFDKLNETYMATEGNYVFVFVSEDTSSAQQLFNSEFKNID